MSARVELLQELLEIAIEVAVDDVSTKNEGPDRSGPPLTLDSTRSEKRGRRGA